MRSDLERFDDFKNVEFLRERATYTPGPRGYALFRGHSDKDAETIVNHHLVEDRQRDDIRRLWITAGRVVSDDGHKLQVDDWRSCFEERLRLKNVPSFFNQPHAKDDIDWDGADVNAPNFYINAINYIRCAGEYLRTDLNEDVIAAQVEAAKLRESQLDLFEAMHMAGYLQCDLQQK